MMYKYIYFSILILIIIQPIQALAGDRIISLKPNVTDILFDLGRGGEVVGVTSYCSLPDGAAKREVVANYMNVDVEKVLLLRPTFVIGSKENSSVKEVEFLRERGVKVDLFPFRTVEETLESIRATSDVLGISAKGEKLSGEIQKGLAELGKRVDAAGKNRSALVVVGTKPLVVVGEENLIDDLLDLFGVRNVVGKSHLKYPTWSVEQMISAKPDIIIDLSMGSERRVSECRSIGVSKCPESGEKQALDWYRQFSSVPAVRNDRIYFLDMGDFRASRRILEGARNLRDILNSPPP